MNYEERIEALLDDMSIFEDWTEKYEFIISLGRKLPPMP
jgi:cysteine desulfuration protein SufE